MAERVLAITGGASGIGLAVAEAALAEGWRVAVADRDPAALERARDLLDPARSSITALDVTDESAVEAWITATAGQGRLAGAVAAAGIAADIPALDTPTELFRRILDVNVTGSFLLARSAGRAMRDSGGGSILCIASVTGLRGAKGRVAYGASKAGVINLAQVMAIDLAPYGIRVNALCPGPVETPLVARLHGPEMRAQWLRHLPLRRYATPEEITPMVLFLLDEAKSSYLTGQAIAVDGGYAGAGLMPPGN
ncbi:SDR family NAD(P)-dependent oxidoreductase [Siccirubricoccus sp. G192]|uniref:SDR family NAD(P)-dependent oxidoreductase n=1 Tax=Siccirubricoccus sp. G192 TaxID=2849651 RepID=UPI001C2C7CC4|nr:SDR family oxidoreductase [Siccirubricoccus sp. G192]MBV1798803.1 SDR family oxidoreductase [Siccirubricoccus sp. G192]